MARLWKMACRDSSNMRSLRDTL